MRETLLREGKRGQARSCIVLNGDWYNPTIAVRVMYSTVAESDG
jgi:hypothetical protein